MVPREAAEALEAMSAQRNACRKEMRFTRFCQRSSGSSFCAVRQSAPPSKRKGGMGGCLERVSRIYSASTSTYAAVPHGQIVLKGCAGRTTRAICRRAAGRVRFLSSFREGAWDFLDRSRWEPLTDSQYVEMVERWCFVFFGLPYRHLLFA